MRDIDALLRRRVPPIDPHSGEPNFKLSVDVHVVGERLPRIYSVRSWATLPAWMRSPEFKAIAPRIEMMTIHNTEAR